MTDEKEPEDKADAIALSDEGPITTTELAIGLQEIARTTDALVRRVAEGGGVRDRSEHVLDQARFSNQEENAFGNQHNVRCDRCGIKSPGAANPERANAIAQQIGWLVSEEFDHCPTCRDDGAKQIGEGQASVYSEMIPDEMSIPDKILVTRTEWLTERFESGATPVATIMNARRSGHRTMLTDLAKGFGYDEAAFFQKVSTVDSVGLFRWAVAETSAWNFVRKLFLLLKLEDEK